MLPPIHGHFRAVADSELRFTPSGKQVCSFRAVAVSKKKDQNGEWQDDKIIWVRVVVFDRLAEHVAESVLKGTPVIVHGRIHNSEWETKEGEKRTTTEIIADRVALDLHYGPGQVRKSDSSGGGGQQQRPNQGQQASNQGQQGGGEPDPWSEDPPF